MIISFSHQIAVKTKKGEKEKEESKVSVLTGVYIFPNGDRYGE